MATSKDVVTFVIPGQLRSDATPDARSDTAPTVGIGGRVRSAARVGTTRAGAGALRLEARVDEDVVVIHLADGPALVLHPYTARDLLAAQAPPSRARGAATPPGAEVEVEVPPTLAWRGLEAAAPTRTRGLLGDVRVALVEIVTGLAPQHVADRVRERVDGQVDAGVYALSAQALSALKGSSTRLDAVPPAPDSQPLLVLLHGSFVDTASTFRSLWERHPDRVRALFDVYGGRVYALDHPTLGASPIANALMLAQALPTGAQVHLLTHSRGGLVAEVLARVCGGEVGAADLDFFNDTAHADQRRDLQTLAALVRAKRLAVTRVVRVACPARGTLLASRRLDAYLSVLRWSLGLAGIPVAPPLLDFLTAVARRREDPARFPGLAAMLPDSPLVRWLNSAAEAIPGDLRVIAGDLKGESVGSWVKTLLADAFFWTDNDIVVQTRSMYGGVPRAGGAAFVLDQGGTVSHFNYFSNARSVDAVLSALRDDRPADYRPIGPLSWAGRDSGGVRARLRSPGRPAAELPAVFVLPGILGSHLKVGDQRVWFSSRIVGGLSRLAYRDGDGVQPDGPIGAFYDELVAFLAASHEVIEFGFDWRRPIEQEARRLGAAVTRALDARNASAQPVRLLAHSMGGLVARTMQLECPDVWQRLMARDGARLLMLGTPNAGSWAPMQVLSGDDTFGNALAAVGAPFQDGQARQWMADMPGFIQLQADLLDERAELDQEKTWRLLAELDLKAVETANVWHRGFLAGDSGSAQLSPYQWGVPPQAVLDAACALRRRLDTQRDRDLPAFADKLKLVVGRARFTPDGVERADEGIVYRNAVDGGDGRVTLASARLPGVQTWTVDGEHGSLPAAKAHFEAYLDLLVNGETTRLKPLANQRGTRAAAAGAGGRPVDRAMEDADTGAVRHERSRPSRDRRSGALPAIEMGSLLETAVNAVEAPGGDAAEPPLRIELLNGDLTFLQQPLLVGHYRSSELTGSESVIDRMLRGSLKASLDAGLYPDEPGCHQIFLNTAADPEDPLRFPRPHAAIVVGLGNEGGLRASELTRTTRQAVIAWSQRLAEARSGGSVRTDLAATLMGSGGLGISPGDAACAIARGVREAVEVIRQGNARRRAHAAGDGSGDWPLITRLILVELYLERAADAWRSLQVQATAAPTHYDIAPTIRFGTGPLRRQIDSAYRGAGYDLITATTPKNQVGLIEYRIDTRRARTEVRAQSTQAKLVRDLVGKASNDANDDPQLGKTLFQLLIPQEMEAFLGGTDRMVLEVDDGTAGIPWELLDAPAGGDTRPWSIRSRLLRKRRTDTFRAVAVDANAEDHVLVIGEPLIDPPRPGEAGYGPLPGAQAEAEAVARTFRGPGGVGEAHVTALLDKPDAGSVLNALLARRYRIVHIAGHGDPSEKGGVVLSGGTFLSACEIKTMRTVPELVFVNCCHLAARDSNQLLTRIDRPQFAANVAEALIEIGVRCVVAAGWAVEDEPAKVFATTLYSELLARKRFIDAIASARDAARTLPNGGNTWAAYQCYGDPDWVFRERTGDAQQGGTDLRQDYAAIASPLGLTFALEELAVQTEYQRRSADKQLERVRHLDGRFGNTWAGMGAVAEAFGVAYAAAGAFDSAVDWFGRAIRCNDASASMRATEQWLNLRARQAYEAVRRQQPVERTTLDASRAEIEDVIRRLDQLIALQPTMERHSLSGSAWKRLTLLERKAGDRPAAAAAAARAAAAYLAATDLAQAAQATTLFYPAQNYLSTALVAHEDDAAWTGFDHGLLARVRASLQTCITQNPEFWCVIGVIELDIFRALAARRLPQTLADVLTRLHDVQSRAQAPAKWGSVANNLEFVLGLRAARDSATYCAAAEQLLNTVQGYAPRN